MEINELRIVRSLLTLRYEDFDEFENMRRNCKDFPSILYFAQKVYGGYVGEKLSKNSPDIVWETLLKMRVRQIIDLRYGYNSSTYRSRCETYGIRYFSYPIHNDP